MKGGQYEATVPEGVAGINIARLMSVFLSSLILGARWSIKSNPDPESSFLPDFCLWRKKKTKPLDLEELNKLLDYDEPSKNENN